MSAKRVVVSIGLLLLALAVVPAYADQITIGPNTAGTASFQGTGTGSVNITAFTLSGGGSFDKSGGGSTIGTYAFTTTGTPVLVPSGGNFALNFSAGNTLNFSFCIPNCGAPTSSVAGFFTFVTVISNGSTGTLAFFDGPGQLHVTSSSGAPLNVFTAGNGYQADFTLNNLSTNLSALASTTNSITNVGMSSGEILVPEPASMVLMGTGLLGLAGAVRRKLRK